MASPSYKMFGCFTRKFKINEVRPPVDVSEAFFRYTSDGVMTTAHLRQFLVEVQGMEEAEADSQSQRICRLITQKRNIFSKKQGLSVHNDMSAPLQHYFIYTGHNSYLTGNQLSSDCSDVPIINALQSGVRVIELDIWPNSTKDDIDVLHGRTLTTPVPLKQCLKSIKEHAFETSPYPVVITLEDHLTPDLQAKVAKMVTETFETMLFYPNSESLEAMPSPEELKYKIILSTKPPKEYLETKQGKENEETSLDPEEALGDVTPCNSDSDPEEEEFDSYSAKSKVAPEYKQLIAIRAGKPKNGLQRELTARSQNVRRLSLNEQALEKAASQYGMDVVRFTQNNFLRIYPKGTRIGSSNYQPMEAWSHGAQMVAFNMQGYGKALWLMQGMFRSNGGCGYVKKPEILMKSPDAEDIVYNPQLPLPVKSTLKASIILSTMFHDVTLYMGNGWNFDFAKTHFDSFSPPDFYAKVRSIGVPADCRKHKTQIIEDNWVPIWDEEIVFTFTVPELALLQIVVKEHDVSEKDDFGGQVCLPVCEIKQGFRAVSLFDKKGEKLPNTKLLMRFEFV
ncbi:hypothetical protein V2J09_014135 [Rumex salicifolius]